MNKRKRILPRLSLGLRMPADRHPYYDSKMTSCHVCYSSRPGGRMFNLLIYESGTILEKKKEITREIAFPSSPHCCRLPWSGVFSVYGLAFWNDWASSFLLSPIGTLVTQECALGELSRSVREHTRSLVNPERPRPTSSPVRVQSARFLFTLNPGHIMSIPLSPCLCEAHSQ